jgi:hypothetical protein
MLNTFFHLVDAIAGPTTIYFFSVAIFLLLMFKGDWIVKPKVTAGILFLILIFGVLAFQNDHFFHIITLPDNIPITLMLASVGFFTWYSVKRGVENDRRLDEGKPVLEKEQGGRSMTWPNLVYIEFIALILMTVFLLVWSLVFKAPLEQPANPSLTPNPSKAPWYFLGLQEMLVYFDPWLAGVVYPGLIIVGLIAIPFIDLNPIGNGYYTFKKRRFAISMFLFGFIIQWVLLVMLGTFMRGPGWNFFGPFEPWDPHKVVPMVNINLSEIIWVKILGTGLPQNILVRESFGIFLVFGYLLAFPPLLAKTIFKRFYTELGFIRYNVLCFLFLALMSLPIKMLLRWTLNLKYLVAIPEFFFNI